MSCDLARPSDEIRSVTRTILDILSGQSTSDAGRSLRTAAPAGATKVAERQRRAYRQVTQQRSRPTDVVTKLPRQAMDAAWELRRELQSESSRPGYKTEPIRTALQEGVQSTSNYLKAVKQQRQLQVSRKAVARLQQAQEVVTTTQAALLEQVCRERVDVLERLQDCIESPENTWLSEEAVAAAAKDDNLKLDSDGLQQVVTLMIEIRDGIKETSEENDYAQPLLFDDRIQELVAIRHRIAGLQDRTAAAVSTTIAQTLFNEILGIDPEFNADDVESGPVMLRLEELQESYDKLQVTQTEVEQEYAGLEESLVGLEKAVASFQLETGQDLEVGDAYDGQWMAEDMNEFEPASNVAEPWITIPSFVDVVPEALYTKDTAPFYAAEIIEDNDDDEFLQSGPRFVAEIVDDDDDDFDAAFGQARVTTAADEDETKEPNLLADLSLRSLDIVFYVLEKTFTVVIPNAFRIGQTVTDRLQEIQKTNNGSRGWERVRNTVDAKGRY